MECNCNLEFTQELCLSNIFRYFTLVLPFVIINASTQIHLFDNFSYQLLCRVRLLIVDRLSFVMCNQTKSRTLIETTEW